MINPETRDVRIEGSGRLPTPIRAGDDTTRTVAYRDDATVRSMRRMDHRWSRRFACRTLSAGSSSGKNGYPFTHTPVDPSPESILNR
jgi:hypothetical protein